MSPEPRLPSVSASRATPPPEPPLTSRRVAWSSPSSDPCRPSPLKPGSVPPSKLRLRPLLRAPLCRPSSSDAGPCSVPPEPPSLDLCRPPSSGAGLESLSTTPQIRARLPPPSAPDSGWQHAMELLLGREDDGGGGGDGEVHHSSSSRPLRRSSSLLWPRALPPGSLLPAPTPDPAP